MRPAGLLAVAALVAVAGFAVADRAGAAPSTASAPVGAPCAEEVMAQPPQAAGNTTVAATDPTGRYQVGLLVADVGTDYRVVRWRDGAPVVLAGRSGLLDVADVNQSGEVVGTSFGGSPQQAWVYREGGFAELPPLGPDYSATVTAINGAGEVAGTQTDGAGLTHAVLWSPPRSVRALPLPAGYAQTVVTGLDEDGTVVGYAYTEPTSPSPGAPVVWPVGGGVRVLTAPHGGELGYPVVAAARILSVNERTELLEWDARGGAPVVLADQIGDLAAVNSRGSVLVTATDPDGRSVAALLRGGELRPVPGTAGNGLSDRDTVYHTLPGGNGITLPARYDCTG
jgi:hypothetical protein